MTAAAPTAGRRFRRAQVLALGAAIVAAPTVLGVLFVEDSPALAENAGAANAGAANPDAGAPAPAAAPVQIGNGNGNGGAVRLPNVKIIFKINPPTRATVSWGKRRLGIIKGKEPLIIERPRDSGPLDVVVRAEGCLPVHTRAYTFTSSVVAVKVTPVDKKNTLFGYREEVTDADGGAGPGASPDGGVPPPAPGP